MLTTGQRQVTRRVQAVPTACGPPR
jgi:hypothetical protein